jgi:hypothetical protein
MNPIAEEIASYIGSSINNNEENLKHYRKGTFRWWSFRKISLGFWR